MKYKIDRIITPDNHIFFSVYFKQWYSFKWTIVSAFYKSEIDDMPGWWCNTFNSLEEAKLALLKHRSGEKLSVKTIYRD